MRAFVAGWVWAILVTAAWGADPVRVVTTLPDLADWVRQVGGEQMEVTSLLRGFENPHTYEPKVSDVKAVAGARLLVTVGLGLEEWTAGLVENARNGDLLVVEAGREALRGGARPDRGAGHPHPEGNPHVWLDPDKAARMCRAIARGLETVDPAGRDGYRARLARYLERLEATAARLRRRVAALPDRRFLSYHPAWPHFARGLGFELVGVVTEVPGREPSARALAALVNRIRKEKIRVLATEPQLSSKLPELLRQETGIRVVSLSPLLGSGPAADYLELLEANASALIAALEGAQR
ncbi:MAG: metal ABC transporter substrate-binding protein [Deferrisomatales bacterium]